MPGTKQVNLSERRVDHQEEPHIAGSDSESDQETIEVQVEKARKRAKGVPAHKKTGEAVQAKGVAAKKAQGAASLREREIARMAKKNNQLERLAKIEEMEQAERERGAALAAKTQPKEPTKNSTEGGDIDARFARLEELLTIRNAQEDAAPKTKAKPKRKPPARAPDTSDDDDETPRQKSVRRSAKTELRKRAGAHEEELNKKGHLVGNRHKKDAMALDHEAQFLQMASQLMPGRF